MTNSKRDADQTDLAHFWSENFVAQLPRAVRAIVDAHVPDTGDAARLFALTALATADAFITCWESKYHFSFWRPITAIREGENDGNAKTVGDPTWTPLIDTPNYPDYTSGANNITAAYMKMLELFFGTDSFDFIITSNAPLAIDKTREYHSFSQADAGSRRGPDPPGDSLPLRRRAGAGTRKPRGALGVSEVLETSSLRAR